MNADFWNGRRVLITGHTGFKGSWLTLWLARAGAEVTGFALAPPSQPSLFELARLDQLCHSLHGDVRDPSALAQAFASSRPEIVLHLAAQALVRPSYEDPVTTFDTNVMGTVQVLDRVRRATSVRSVVVVTSDKCYDNREWLWPYREDEPMGGHDPYSSSKGCAELVTAAYRRSFLAGADAPAVASARAGNVIGGGDWGRDRLIPDLMRATAAGRSTEIRSPAAIRPWQHVLEPLAGYLRLAERLAGDDGASFAEGWNFGPALHDSRTVGWVLQRLADHWGPGLTWQHQGGEQPHEAHTLRLDASKAHTLLGWRPRLALDDALAWVAEWYRQQTAGDDARQLCAAQIDRYQELDDGAQGS